MKTLLLATAALTLAACAHSQQAAIVHDVCVNRGLTPGTAAFSKCTLAVAYATRHTNAAKDGPPAATVRGYSGAVMSCGNPDGPVQATTCF